MSSQSRYIGVALLLVPTFERASTPKAGVPVLTNLTSNIGDYLSEGVNGYPLDVTSDETLKASLLRVLTQSRESITELK